MRVRRPGIKYYWTKANEKKCVGCLLINEVQEGSISICVILSIEFDLEVPSWNTLNPESILMKTCFLPPFIFSYSLALQSHLTLHPTNGEVKNHDVPCEYHVSHRPGKLGDFSSFATNWKFSSSCIIRTFLKIYGSFRVFPRLIRSRTK